MMLAGREIRKAVSLVSSPLGDELLIYDSASGSVHVLNRTAHQVWRWLDDGIEAAEMVNRFCAAYAGVTPETADRDVRSILRTFVETAIVTTPMESPANAIREAL
jgi:hypothetical protein